MARQARIKPSDRGTYYHVMNRISGLPGEFPFDDVEKEKLVRLIHKWSRYFTVEPIAYQIMGNHYHLVCYAPGEDEKLSAPEAAERHNRFYAGKAPALTASEPDCERIAERMRDVSAFVGQIQQVFACWFNPVKLGATPPKTAYNVRRDTDCTDSDCPPRCRSKIQAKTTQRHKSPVPIPVPKFP